jgi:hypothetical protein
MRASESFPKVMATRAEREASKRYLLRMRRAIEEFFKALKTGCSFEKRPLESLNLGSASGNCQRGTDQPDRGSGAPIRWALEL